MGEYMEKTAVKLLHYTDDDKTPYCGCHLAYPGDHYVITRKMTMKKAEFLRLELCDLCLYIKWRMENHSDILSNMEKCTVGVTAYPGEEDIYLACDIPKLLHEGIPEDDQVHWDFSMGYWLGYDVDSCVSV
jgi:hypothetical protein